jgi:hypothetical protein
MLKEVRLGKRTYGGVFMVALATLMYEILLTRIFSVNMWYHFAFMAISVAMFGMTVGAILVFLYPKYFSQDRTQYHLVMSSWWFALSSVITFLTQQAIPFAQPEAIYFSATVLWSWLVLYFVTSIPFIFSGICICLALTRFPGRLNRIYAADLAGAAVGCVAVILTLEITDGPTAVFVVACLANAGTLFFLDPETGKSIRRRAKMTFVVLVAITVGHTALVYHGMPIIRLMWVKGNLENIPPYEKWNSFSRIRVADPVYEKPFGWGLSPVYPSDRRVTQMDLVIDSAAGTRLTKFDGDLAGLEHLKFDVTNIAHYIRKNSDVLVVGVGGARDVLSALVFEQKSVLGVELNRNIFRLLNGRFGDFAGHLDRLPNVVFVNDEARSYIARQTKSFDIIQISLIDTFAATSAGAFALSENSLYTLEAWKTFLDHLTPSGILSVSRWFTQETQRTASLATRALMNHGIELPEEHTLVVKCGNVGNVLISKQPFSEKDLTIIEEVSKAMKFEIVFSPNGSAHPNYRSLCSGKDYAQYVKNFPLNLAPPTDDSPFFFQMVRAEDFLQPLKWLSDTGLQAQNKGVTTLVVVLLVMLILSALCILGPLAFRAGGEVTRSDLPFVLFFGGIGLGFMLVEISQLQRFIIFLGHPTYSLSVVLFSLLLSTGLGSRLAGQVNPNQPFVHVTLGLVILLLALIGYGMAITHATAAYETSATVTRILLVVSFLFPLGFCMGMAFPMGMILASEKSPMLTPWLWGINGATSVCGSVLGVIIAIFFGISTTFWVGVGCYAVASAALLYSAFDGSARARVDSSALGCSSSKGRSVPEGRLKELIPMRFLTDDTNSISNCRIPASVGADPCVCPFHGRTRGCGLTKGMLRL